jgi:hypothetical protein
MPLFKLLLGHISMETSYVIEDYPYGGLRCKRRCWIETRPKMGQRFVTQTSNPKKAGLVWNKPHAGTYSRLCVMYLNPENNHVEIMGLGLYSYRDAVEAFINQFGWDELIKDPYIAKMLPLLRKLAYEPKAETKP